MKKIYFFLILFLLNFFTLQSQTVDYIYSNFGGYWESGVGNLNPTNPNNHHELLAFRFSSTVYSTGVNNALLDANGVTYANTTYKALPVQDGSFPTSPGSGGPLLFAIGSMWDGSTSIAQEPGPFTIPPLFSEMLNDGANGLDLGTAITNIPGSAAPLDFLLSSIPDLSMIADGIPDIVVSQLAQPSSTLDAIYFEDASGNLVGNVLTIDFSNSSNTPDLGTWAADFYDPNTGLSNGSSFVNSTRPIKLWARDASAFGINSSNYMNVARLRYDLGGTSDPAFIAYNSAFISVFEAVDDEVTTTYNTPVVIDVLENDTVVLPVTVTISSPPSSGTVSVDPATNEITYTPDSGFSGTVTFEYEVCRGGTCDTATVTVTVENNIEANNDTFTFDGNDTPSVLNNDTLNGTAVDPTEINITVVTNDPELTLNPDGTVSVDPSATPGTYTLEYQICEVANPTNCDTATVTITVENNIEANNDTFTFDGNDTTSVLDNDTLNGSAVDPTDVNITVVSNDPELTMNPDGTITVDPSATPGTYTLDYQICEVANPTNCDTATVTITVENNIEANDDTFTFDGNDTTSVLDNDTLNGTAVNPTDVNITVVSNDPELTMNPDGTITVDPSATPGTYTLDYQICEVANPTNCDTATVTITVENNIEANDDTFTFDGNDTPSVLDNDTLNGTAVNPTDVNITVVSNDPELTMNPDGTITVDPSATPGTYTLDYQICEVANPTNCDTATVTITVENNIEANNDTFTFDGNDTPSVLDNDTLNGTAVNPTDVNITVVSNDPELTMNPDGTITVDPSATPGTYTLDYQICEVANPTNCDTATVTITVENNIEANNDTFTFDGNDTPSVLNNDTLNGSAVDPTEINITVVTNDPELTMNPDGTITVDPSATPGTYTLDYQICEVANPTNCDTATVTITVENNIEANNDTFTFDGNDTPSVLNNDTLNGSAVDPTEINITVITNDPELTMNPDSTVSVDPSATPGTYTLEYQICEVANPTNCDTATVTITVENNIEANNDTFTFDGNDTPSVLNNDTLNGSAVDPTEINITVVTNDPELTLNPDGTVSVDPSATPGTYTLEYQICEVANPTNCDTATVTITVENNIEANNDTFTFDGNDTPSVLNNDTLNGSAVDPTEINITVITNDPELTLNPDGTVSVDPSATPGTYTLEYQICEVANPTNCDTATVTITVENNIEANNDTFTFDGNDTTSVLNNDTLNGSAVDPTEINITVVTNDPELTMNPDGTITVDPSATPGTYTLDYQICEVANPTNCDTATVTITVENNIEANDDTFTFDGNDTTSVLDNDTLNGTAVNPTDVNITVVSNDPELTMNPDGTITVDPSATPGTYTLDYQICEVANPTNCDTATVTITVENNIEANDDTFTFDGNDTPSVLDNDTLNGTAVNPTDVNITVVSNDPELTMNPDGTITVDPSATPGTYTLDYQICEVANPTNCDTATVTITVENNIEANNDTFTFDGNDTPSVLDNDTLNGTAVNPTDVNITVVSNDPELTMNPDGTITVDPSATPGTYTLDYQICEVANPTNCDTATVTITVENNIEANDDTFTFDGNDTPSVLDNDTLNGTAVNPTDVNITVVSNDPELTMNPDGTITVDPSATPGTYTLDYQICEVANPTNCDTATVTITVLQQELVIYNAVSPNNDGVNDSFLIQGLENYPDNEVEIYNRWGTKVYAARSYNNTSVAFNGYSNVDRSLNQNEGLPSGTYFYIIKYTDNDGNSVSKTGYLYLN